jgi:hypothetical protein
MSALTQRTPEQQAFIAEIRANNRASSIYAWTATRSGATMTIRGVDADGMSVKLAGVTSITCHPEAVETVYAISTDGVWQLRLGSRPQ